MKTENSIDLFAGQTIFSKVPGMKHNLRKQSAQPFPTTAAPYF